MNATWHNLLKPLTLGVELLALALLALAWSGAPPARAALAQGLGQAGPTCTVCLGGGCAYTTIQAAVDDPGCMEIKVAQGVYSGVQARPAPAGYPYPPSSGLITQVVYISRTVTVRGGYTTTNWATPHPLTQPTTLDARGLGRALAIAGAISPTIEGLGLTNGNAAESCGDYFGGVGGGVYVLSATATIRNCRVFSNAAYAGGGLFLVSSPAMLISNSVASNTAMFGGGLELGGGNATIISNSIAFNTASYGGGLELGGSPTLISNSITANTAYYDGGGLVLGGSPTLISNSITANRANNGFGGGLHLIQSAATLSANSVASNSATYGGGLAFTPPTAIGTPPPSPCANSVSSDTAYAEGDGLSLQGGPVMFSANTPYANSGRLSLDDGPATLNANSVTANTATYGGGLYLYESAATLSVNSMISNTAAQYGGGLYLWSSSAELTNTIISDNRAGTYGSGLYIYGASAPRLVHTTIARNRGGDGSGLYVYPGNTIWLTNTILVSHTVGISVAAGSTATLNGTLWYGNGADMGGAGTIHHSGDVSGDPAFVDPDHGDYHIGPSSAANDCGVAAGVATDKDGQCRNTVHPDLGAYEFGTPIYIYHLPVVVKGAR
jgi:hypothetical protein